MLHPNLKSNCVVLRVQFGKNCRLIFSKYGILQQSLANYFGIDPSNLSKILDGRYNYGVDICLALSTFIKYIESLSDNDRKIYIPDFNNRYLHHKNE